MSIRTDQHARNVVEKLESALKSARTVLTDICLDEAAADSASAVLGECDWGHCSRPAVGTRIDPEHGDELPVCSVHMADTTEAHSEVYCSKCAGPHRSRTGHSKPTRGEASVPKPSDPRYDRLCPGCGVRIGSHGPVDSARCLAKLGLEDSVTRKGGYQGSAGPVPKRVDGPAAGVNPPSTGQGTAARGKAGDEMARILRTLTRNSEGIGQEQPTWKAAYEAWDATPADGSSSDRYPTLRATRGVQSGDLCVGRTRIPTASLWGLWENRGLKPGDVQALYPDLTIDEVEWAMEYERRQRSYHGPGATVKQNDLARSDTAWILDASVPSNGTSSEG